MSLDGTTRTIRIVSGSSSTSFDGINRFTYILPGQGFKTGRDEVALRSLSMYFSLFNISAEQANNTFSYIWPDNITYSVVLGDGIWQYSDISAYLQAVMISRNHYLVNTAGANVYYLDLAENSVLYCLSITATPLPVTMPIGWTNPGINLTTAAGRIPRFIVPLGTSALLGLSPGTYPNIDQTVIYQRNSGIPQISTATSYNLNCSIVDNSGFSLMPNVLASFPKPEGQSAGALMRIEPTNQDWVPIQQSTTFQTIEVWVTDQLSRDIKIRDPAGFIVILNVRRRN